MNDLDASTERSGDVRAYVQALFGGLPPHCARFTSTLVHELHQATRHMRVYRVDVDAPLALSWHLTLYLPLPLPRTGCPVLLSPDGCWPHVITPDAINAVLAQGIGMAFFDRLQLAHDRPDGQRSGPIYAAWPQASWGALSAWAWGLRQSVHALQNMREVKADAIAVIGHSRGGKAALLAGATDPAIALTVAHNSGCAGAASFHNGGPAAESLSQLQASFPHWLAADGPDSEAQQRIQALDNIALLDGLSGRHLCVMQADDDLWANPAGTRHAVARLRSLWAARGLNSHLTHITRTGGHAMSGIDWSRAAHTWAAILRHQNAGASEPAD